MAEQAQRLAAEAGDMEEDEEKQNGPPAKAARLDAEAKSLAEAQRLAGDMEEDEEKQQNSQRIDVRFDGKSANGRTTYATWFVYR